MLRRAPLFQRAALTSVRAMASSAKWNIQYTICDEAPQLATYALLPVLRRIIEPFGIRVDAPDISLAARIISQFPDRLTKEQQKPDALSELGALTQRPEANIIKLPNISASIPQLVDAITELQKKGYNIPNFVQNPKSAAEEDALARYSKVLGSAVNPVIREGNSDRRVAVPVKKNAQRNKPPVRMQAWEKTSATHVAHMQGGDFYGSEVSTVVASAGTVSIEFIGADNAKKVLKTGLKLTAGELIDASVMSRKALRSYFESEFAEAQKANLMVSLHLKATMMKISDPIIFGHAVSTYYADTFAKHADTFAKNGINPNNGLADVLAKIEKLPKDVAATIKADLAAEGARRPPLAMVDSVKGITNLHVPNDVIIDASMPPLVRDGGRMWNRDNKLADTKALIPDRSYAGIYQTIIEDCKVNGQFNHATMGSVANVGLMAQKAEEYGSHDKTFEIASAGRVLVKDDATGKTLFEHKVEKGDIWRMCQTKDEPIRDWVKLAVTRARASKTPAIFWLDQNRAHDRLLIEKVNGYLKEHELKGVDVFILDPKTAMKSTLARVRAGNDTISVTGNVLRDYLTDLFPILELGTSAKMLSIVPLLKGGGVFETGAGGSAPKHVEQFQKEGHLRWDSLGEYLAVAVSLEHMALVSKQMEPALLAETLNMAVERLLDNNKSPSRRAKEIDNRGSTFYVAKYWSEELAKRDARFKTLADALAKNEAKISADLVDCQGTRVDYGGYYLPDTAKVNAAMRPSATLNAIIDAPAPGVSSKL